MIRAIRPRVIKQNGPASTRRTVVTAAIIVALAAPALYLVGVWALFAEWLGMGWAFLADSTLVPNWLLVFLTICAFIVCGLLGAALRPTREAADPENHEPPD
jgi:fatty acid desaturase